MGVLLAHTSRQPMSTESIRGLCSRPLLAVVQTSGFSGFEVEQPHAARRQKNSLAASPLRKLIRRSAFTSGRFYVIRYAITPMAPYRCTILATSQPQYTSSYLTSRRAVISFGALLPIITLRRVAHVPAPQFYNLKTGRHEIWAGLQIGFRSDSWHLNVRSYSKLTSRSDRRSSRRLGYSAWQHARGSDGA